MKALRASGANRWVNCPGSVFMPTEPRTEDTEAADEGKFVHEEAAHCILNETTSKNEDVQGYVDFVGSLVGRLSDIFIEKKVDPSYYLSACVSGTCDAAIFDHRNKKIHIIDFKYGRKRVEVKNNYQLAVYLFGIFPLFGLGLENVSSESWTINFHIYQPRAFNPEGPVLTWAPGHPELKNILFRIQEAVQAIKDNDPTRRTGEHCVYCPSMTNCPEFRKSAQTVFDFFGDSRPENLTPENIGAELAMLNRAQTIIKQRLAAIEQKAMSEIQSGKVVPGWAIGSSKGKRFWSAELSEIKALGDLLGVALTEEKPIGISKALKGPKNHKKAIEKLLDSSTPAPKLVPFNETLVKEKFKND